AALAAMAILLPHNSGLHPGVSPPGARVPTLLYFDYYYTYPFSVLAILALVLTSARGLARPPRGLIGLALVTLASASNVSHALPGPRTALQTDEWTADKVDAVRQVLALDDLARAHHANGPIYVSFPSGDRPLIDC